MNFSINVTHSELNAMAGELTEHVKASRLFVHEAMARRCKEVVIGNFGIAGVDRPWSWQPLTPEYAKKVKRTIATLFVSGDMQEAVDIRVGVNRGQVYLSDDVIPYATAHHDGNPKGNRSHPGLPARRVFPITGGGNVLPYTVSQVKEAAIKELERQL